MVLESPLFFAGLGGFAVNILNLMELQNVPKEERPDFSDWLYWLPFVAWPLIAVFLAYVYVSSGIPLRPILAVNVGISAPLIIRSMMSSAPISNPIDPGQDA